MQKIFKKVLSVWLAFAVCVGALSLYGAVEWTVADAATDYYAGITAAGGNSLLGQLHDLITTTHTYYTSYGECSESQYVNVTDPGPNGGALEFYTQESIMSFSGNVGHWNREHVWCKSLSNGMWTNVSNSSRNGGTDMHHIRPSESGLNSTRGSNKFGEVSGGKEAYSKNTSNQPVTLGGYVGGGAFEPLDKVKGDVARIVMYVYTHYNTYKNVNGTTNGSQSGVFGTLNFTHIMSASSEAAAKQLLLKWNKADPVDDIERIRNEEVYKIQGNRNPFIDNASYAEAIWGDGTIIDPPPVVTLQSISLNKTAFTLTVGDTQTLTVTPNPSNASASVSWTSSNTAVASVSGGKVTAKAAGTAIITATSTTDASIKAMATVTVKAGSGTSTETTAGKVTIKRDSFEIETGGYDLYTWTAGKIEGVAFIYAGNADTMQFNTKQTSKYLASTEPTAGPIRKVTISTSGNNTSWSLLTSTQPYDSIASGNPTNGNTHTGSDGTWTVDGNDTYFALVLGGSGASYISSIEVEYGTGGGSDTTPELESISLNPSAFTLQEGGSTRLSVLSVSSTVTAEVNWTSSNEAVAKVAADGTVTAVAAGKATITATSRSNSSIKATATVIVTSLSSGEEDGEGIMDFCLAVEAIDESDTLTERYAQIYEAVVAYRALSEADKAVCADEIEVLRAAIASYNEAVKAYNGAADNADEAALKGLGKFL